MFFKSLVATFKRNFISMIRAYPMSFFIGGVLTVFYTVMGAYFMYTVMFRGHINESFVSYTGTGDYMTYVIIGSLSFSLLVRTLLNVSRSLITELRQGTLESLMLAPFSRMGYFAGNMAQQTITTLGELSISLIICIPFGIDISNINGPTFILGILISLYCYFGLAMCLGAVMIYTRDTYISQNTLFLLIFLICGIVFPSEYLPKWLQYVSNVLPVKDAVNIVRASVINGRTPIMLFDTYIKLIVMGSAYFAVGFMAIKKIEKIALEKIFG